ncbi:hypothetical protein WJX74_010077 [Apatococcus lobatus]|uniref:Uncharacterized protein n=1 Tax=Apatococcus lobatus TaxID=904363 RepID=A0AAW1RDJ2_9CHLO
MDRVQPLGNGALFVDQHFMPKAVDLQPHEFATDPQLIADSAFLYDRHIAGSSTVSWPPQHCCVTLLPKPLMLSDHTPAAAASAILRHMQAICKPAVQIHLQLPLASPTTSKDFLAQDLLLEESCMMLPPVLLDPLNKLCAEQVESPMGLQHVISDLRAKPFRSLTHLEVYLDWTLSDPSRAGAMQQKVVAAKKWIVDQLSPSQEKVHVAELPEGLVGLTDLIHGPPLRQPEFMKQAPPVPRYLSLASRAQSSSIRKLQAGLQRKAQPSTAACTADMKQSNSQAAFKGSSDAQTALAGSLTKRPSVPMNQASSRDEQAHSSKLAAADSDGHAHVAQQCTGSSLVSAGAQAAVLETSAGQQGVFGKKPRKAHKCNPPDRPSSGLNFWLQIRQKATSNPGQNKGLGKQPLSEAIQEHGMVSVPEVPPSSGAGAWRSRGIPKQAYPEARSDNARQAMQLDLGDKAVHSNSDRCPNPVVAQHGVPDGHDSDLSSESSQELLALDQHDLASVPSHVEVKWPPEHAALLQTLQTAHARIADRTAGLPDDVLDSSFCNPKPATTALATMFQEHQHHTGTLASVKPVIRALVSIAILQQASLVLRDYGVRCAHLVMRHQVSILHPGQKLAEPCRAAADALFTAYEQVEAGLIDDHPKHQALSSLLIGLKTLTPGCKVLIVCGSGEAFSLFGAIKAANFRAVHLPPAMTACPEKKVPAQTPAVERARARLAASGECTLLVSASQLGMLGSVTAMISHAVDYAPSMVGDAQHAQHEGPPHLPAFSGIWHILQTQIPPADPPNPASDAPQHNLQQHEEALQGKENLVHASSNSMHTSAQQPNGPVANIDAGQQEATDASGLQLIPEAHEEAAANLQHKRKVLQPSLEYMLGNAKHSSGRRAQAMHQMRVRQAEEEAAAAAKRARAARITPLKRKPTPKNCDGAPAKERAHAAPARQQTLPAMTTGFQHASTPHRAPASVHAHRPDRIQAGNNMSLNVDGQMPLAKHQLDCEKAAQHGRMAETELDLTSVAHAALHDQILEPSRPSEEAAGEGAASCCIAIDLQSSDLLQKRRPLYEAVLRLESSGISIVERALRGPDIALTPDTCLCIWEASSYQAGDAHLPPALMPSIATRVWEASFGFSKALLVFEGGNAFQWKLATCLPAILKATRRARMTCQLMVSGSSEKTKEVVTSIIKNILKLGPGQKPLQGPIMPDQQTPAEAFLTSFSALNPLSIASIGSLGLTCVQLLAMSEAEQQALASRLRCVSPRALQLFFAQVRVFTTSKGSRGSCMEMAYSQGQASSPAQAACQDSKPLLNIPQKLKQHLPSAMNIYKPGQRTCQAHQHGLRATYKMRQTMECMPAGNQALLGPPGGSAYAHRPAAGQSVPFAHAPGPSSTIPAHATWKDNGPHFQPSHARQDAYGNLYFAEDHPRGTAGRRNKRGRLVDEFGIEEDADLENLRFSQPGDGPPSYPNLRRGMTTAAVACPEEPPRTRHPQPSKSVDPEDVVDQVMRKRQAKRILVPFAAVEQPVVPRPDLRGAMAPDGLMDLPLESRIGRHAEAGAVQNKPAGQGHRGFPDVEQYACTPLKQRRSGQRKMLNKLKKGGRTAAHRA